MMTHTFEEIWLQVDIENVSTQTLNRIIERKYMNPLPILDIKTLVHIDEICEFNAKVITGNFVHLDSTLFNVIGTETNENCVSSLLSTEYTV